MRCPQGRAHARPADGLERRAVRRRARAAVPQLAALGVLRARRAHQDAHVQPAHFGADGRGGRRGGRLLLHAADVRHGGRLGRRGRGQAQERQRLAVLDVQPPRPGL